MRRETDGQSVLNTSTGGRKAFITQKAYMMNTSPPLRGVGRVVETLVSMFTLRQEYKSNHQPEPFFL